ncbi:hypothetical protein JCGZ_22111 [Jatropha curcas]|uniref:Uncharacterized protein n=1 Tax=Jatropha curcas TaxID=180498 RepID=A0A067JQV6_JATCU|nr:hypothetical protein JCGZ_22111 [Jatropha curcas]
MRRLSLYDCINRPLRATDASRSDQQPPEGVETVVHHRKRNRHRPPRRSLARYPL